MDYSIYEAILTRRMWLCGGICALFTIGLLACLFCIAYTGSHSSKDVSRKQRIEDKIAQWAMYILIVSGLVVCIWLGGSTVWKSFEDIKTQSYVVWEGDITVIQDGPTKSWLYLPDESGIKLAANGLSEGKYTGKVVYAKNSGVVLDCWIDEES